MVKPFMVVLALSYGIDSIMLKRGPQFVQLANGYRYRLFEGSKISRRQSGQVAISGSTMDVAHPDVSLSRMLNPETPVGSSHVCSRL
jgi:hypothetical protein